VSKARLEAFSDGVIAILITIMVLELKTPHGNDWHALIEREFAVGLLSYLLSFVYIAIYWNNHHHMLHASSRVNGTILWANIHLLFWLSLVPFATRWMAETADVHLQHIPTAAYGIVLLLNAIAYTILARALVRQEGPQSKLARAMGRDFKGKVSLALYIAAIPLALFVRPQMSVAIYAIVAMIWFVPDRRVERVLAD